MDDGSLKLAPGSRQKEPSRELLPGLARPKLTNPPSVMVKTLNVAASSKVYTAAGATTLLNGMIRGSTDGTRVGRRIKMIGLDYKGPIMFPITASASFDVLKFAIVYDRATNAAAPAIGDVFNTITATLNPLSMERVEYRNRFWIIQDRIFNAPSVAVTVGGGNSVNTAFNWVDTMASSHVASGAIDLKQAIVIYNSGNAGTVADINIGSLYCIQMSENSSTTWAQSVIFRLRYID